MNIEQRISPGAQDLQATPASHTHQIAEKEGWKLASWLRACWWNLSATPRNKAFISVCS